MTVINSDNISSGYTSTTDLSGSPACIGYSQVLDVSSVIFDQSGNYFLAVLSQHTLNNWDTSFNVTAGVYLCTWSISLRKSSNYSNGEWFNTGVINGASSTPKKYTLTYNGQTYTNLYDSGTNFSSTGLTNTVVNTGSCVINTVNSPSKTFSLLCESRDININNISILSTSSFFQYTRIA